MTEAGFSERSSIGYTGKEAGNMVPSQFAQEVEIKKRTLSVGCVFAAELQPLEKYGFGAFVVEYLTLTYDAQLCHSEVFV